MESFHWKQLNWNLGKLDVVKYLVAKEADIEAKNILGRTAQDVASAEGN